MAQCSFLSASNARNIARNHTLIWSEICALQQAILAAIDNNQYSTIVSTGTPFTATGAITAVNVTAGGALYDLIEATAAVDDNNTGGAGAIIVPVITNGTVSGFSITNGGSGYNPVPATASLAAPANLVDAQDETNYDGVGGDGTFESGDDYFIGEVITLSDSSTITVDNITVTGYVVEQGEDETDYDGAGANGTFTAGSGYAAGNTITLHDGTVVTVDTVLAGAVTEFTITTGSTTKLSTSGQLRVQLSTTGSGTGFSITTDTNNEVEVGAVTEFTVGSAGVVPFFVGELEQESTTGIGEDFTITPSTNNIATLAGGVGAVLTPMVSGGVIANVVINTAGSGYIVDTPVIISHPVGTGAVARVSATNGSGGILAISISSAGSGYSTLVPTVSVDHPTGFGFTGTVQVASEEALFSITTAAGSLTGVTLLDGGSGYLNGVGFTFTITDSTLVGNDDGVISYDVVGGSITNVAVSVPGTGYATVSGLLVSHDDTPDPSGVVTGITITNAGQLYGPVAPTATVTTSTGSGATFDVNLINTPDGEVDTIDVLTGGFGYASSDTIAVSAVSGDDGAGATATLVVDANNFGTTASDYYYEWVGQTSDPVIADQLQFILDYFDALGYNIRIQTNPATNNTIQWQIIW